MGHRRFDELKHNIRAASTLIVGISRFTKSIANPDGSQIIRSSYAASFGKNSPYNTANILLPTNQTRAGGYPSMITNICAMTVVLQLILTAYTFQAELMRGKKLVIFFVSDSFLIDAMDEKIWQYEMNGFRTLNQRAMPLSFWKQYEILQAFWVRLEDYGIEVVMHKCSENFGATGMARTALCLENPVWQWPLSGDNAKRILGLIPIGGVQGKDTDAMDTGDDAEESESECSCEDCEEYEPPESIV